MNAAAQETRDTVRPEPARSVLRASNLRKAYRGRVVVQDLTLHVESGEIVDAKSVAGILWLARRLEAGA